MKERKVGSRSIVNDEVSSSLFKQNKEYTQPKPKKKEFKEYTQRMTKQIRF